MDRPYNRSKQICNNSVTVPCFQFEGDPLRQKDLIMPEPCEFIDPSLPLCSVIRPTSVELAGAQAAANPFNQFRALYGSKSGLFRRAECSGPSRRRRRQGVFLIT
jgi:hypothetical protein